MGESSPGGQLQRSAESFTTIERASNPRTLCYLSLHERTRLSPRLSVVFGITLCQTVPGRSRGLIRPGHQPKRRRLARVPPVPRAARARRKVPVPCPRPQQELGLHSRSLRLLLRPPPRKHPLRGGLESKRQRGLCGQRMRFSRRLTAKLA